MKRSPIIDMVSIAVIVIITVIYVLTDIGIIPSVIYTFLALLSAFFFFPLKFLLFKSDDQKAKFRVINAISDPLISYIIAASVAAIFDADRVGAFRILAIVIGLLNIILLFFHYFKNSRRYYVALHACASLLITWLVFG